jgi:hypothetical protein
VCLVGDVRAQTARGQGLYEVRIEGTVQTSDGAVLPGATVRVFGTALTTTTDGDGRYALVFTHASERLIVVADLDNYRGDDAVVEIDGPLTTTIDFTLTPAFASDVVVIADVPTLNTADDISRITLAPAQVAVLPSLGERDIFRAFQLLPGVSGSQETSSGLYVRGGTPDQNRIEYDGFRVYEVDHLFGYFSAFNMDAIEDVELSKGGFEARHGGVLSSVMQITGKSGRLDRVAGSVGASLLSFNGTVETPLFNNTGSALLAVRRSFQGPLYNRILNLFDNNAAVGPGQAVGQRGGGGGRGGGFATFDTQPSSNFYDINGKVLLNPSPHDTMFLSLYRGNDNLDNSRSLELPEGLLDRLLERGIDPADRGLDLNSSFDITDVRDSGNIGVGFVWSRQWNSRVQSDVSLGYSRFNDVRDRSARVGSNSNPTAEDNRVEDLTFKASVPITLGVGHTLEGGIEVTSNDIAYGFQSGGIGQAGRESPLAAVLNQSTQGRLTALFLQDRWLLGSRLLVVPGVRLTRFDQTSASYTEPRLAATYFVTDRFKLKAAAGRYRQFTNRITREDVLQGDREFWSLANGTTVPVAQATHLIGGGAYERESLLIDVEVFTKDLSDLTQFAPRFVTASDEIDYDDFFYHGEGTVRGGEVLVQKRTGRHTGWVAYTLSKVEELFPGLEPDPFPATHDQRHEVKIVSIFEVGKWHVSETFIYASGKPYTEPVGLEPVELPFGGTIDRVVAGAKNGSRLPDYHRLDLALNREVPLGARGMGILSLTLFNAYDRQNIWYKEFNVVEGEIVENNIQLMGLTFNASFGVKF